MHCFSEQVVETGYVHLGRARELGMSGTVPLYELRPQQRGCRYSVERELTFFPRSGEELQ